MMDEFNGFPENSDHFDGSTERVASLARRLLGDQDIGTSVIMLDDDAISQASVDMEEALAPLDASEQLSLRSSDQSASPIETECDDGEFEYFPTTGLEMEQNLFNANMYVDRLSEVNDVLLLRETGFKIDEHTKRLIIQARQNRNWDKVNYAIDMLQEVEIKLASLMDGPIRTHEEEEWVRFEEGLQTPLPETRRKLIEAAQQQEDERLRCFSFAMQNSLAMSQDERDSGTPNRDEESWLFNKTRTSYQHLDQEERLALTQEVMEDLHPVVRSELHRSVTSINAAAPPVNPMALAHFSGGVLHDRSRPNTLDVLDERKDVMDEIYI
jgi:hypothetical protein